MEIESQAKYVHATYPYTGSRRGCPRTSTTYALPRKHLSRQQFVLQTHSNHCTTVTAVPPTVLGSINLWAVGPLRRPFCGSAAGFPTYSSHHTIVRRICQVRLYVQVSRRQATGTRVLMCAEQGRLALALLLGTNLGIAPRIHVGSDIGLECSGARVCATKPPGRPGWRSS